MARITLDDWYDLCDQFKENTNAGLCWGLGFAGWDYDDGEALKINRDFIKAINDLLQEKESNDGAL